MYTIIVLTLVIAVVVGIITRKISGLAVGTVIGAVVGFVVALFMSFAIPTVWVEDGQWNLAAMRTTDHTTGAFVLGSGSFEGSSSYRVLVRNSDGSMTPFSVTADNRVKIFEDEKLENKGILIIHSKVSDPKSALYNWGLIHSTPHKSYELHVPKGSVVTQFSVKP